ncbi:unnamed protein product, partial [Urochloa humidicola]
RCGLAAIAFSSPPPPVLLARDVASPPALCLPSSDRHCRRIVSTAGVLPAAPPSSPSHRPNGLTFPPLHRPPASTAAQPLVYGSLRLLREGAAVGRISPASARLGASAGRRGMAAGSDVRLHIVHVRPRFVDFPLLLMLPPPPFISVSFCASSSTSSPTKLLDPLSGRPPRSPLPAAGRRQTTPSHLFGFFRRSWP